MVNATAVAAERMRQVAEDRKIDKFKANVDEHLLRAKELFWKKRRQELERLALEEQRDDHQQRILEEERRKLIVDHIIKIRHQAGKCTPKGILRLDIDPHSLKPPPTPPLTY
jgi:hypothetical protein